MMRHADGMVTIQVTPEENEAIERVCNARRCMCHEDVMMGRANMDD
jgi:hypothetical protein